MPSLLKILALPVLLALANAQGVITKAQGTTGSPASTGLQVSLTNTADANVINKTEITDNITNECGRTLLAGNIDIGQNTEDALANKTVTSITKGGVVAVTINQVNTNGAGPYTCDLDPTSNADATGQLALTTSEQDSTTGTISLSVTMPTDLACMGASTGNVCTVRCVNAANYGGCFAVEQTDITPTVNTVTNIATSQGLAAMLAQVTKNQKDLPAVMTAIDVAKTEAEQGTNSISALLKLETRSVKSTAAKKGRAARVFIS